MAARLLETRPEVVEVRLFGSMAAGTATPGSDADVVIVLTNASQPFLERVLDYTRHLADAGVGCDIFPYTESELERLRRDGSAFIDAVDRSSVVLAERPRA